MDQEQFTEHHIVNAAGLSLYCREYPGAGNTAPPLLCIHGLSRNARDFHKLASRLQRDWNIFTPDMRGRGQSDYDPNAANYNLAVYIDDCWQLMDSLGIERCILLGSSMGGLIGTAMAAMRPDRIAGLVLNDIGPDLDPRGIARMRHNVNCTQPDYSYDEAIQRVKDLSRDYFRDYNKQDWHEYMLSGFKLRDDGRYVPDYDPKVYDVVEQDVLVSSNLWDYFGRIINIPVLLLRGEFSDLLSEDTVTKMRTVHPGLQCCTVKNRGHTPLLIEPDSFAAIQKFLADFK